MMRLAIACGVVILVTGCGLLPEISHQPTLHNPFPQLTKVAVAPFINLSTDPKVDPRQFGLAYFAELQAVPGYEVVPIGVVEAAIRNNHFALDTPADLRRLAQFLEVDAVIYGVVTDFDPYYPPRCTLQVDWFSANPCFHEIPAGYGLPWGTPAQEDIPPSLVLESQMALAREQLRTQTPDYKTEPGIPMPARRGDPTRGDGVRMASGETNQSQKRLTAGASNTAGARDANGNVAASDRGAPGQATTSAKSIAAHSVLVGGPDINIVASMSSNWPDPRGLIPAGPSPGHPLSFPTDGPVLRHTGSYHGTDPEFTAALEHYVNFRDDARFGGWAAYMQRSDDFIRFCCHKHIAEMLTARGGAGETKVVWRWPQSR